MVRSPLSALEILTALQRNPPPPRPFSSPIPLPSPIGLIISEATQVSNDGQGYPLTPGVFTPEQIAGWKKITDAVHAKVRDPPPRSVSFSKKKLSISRGRGCNAEPLVSQYHLQHGQWGWQAVCTKTLPLFFRLFETG